jgi:hypothetical protein
MITKSTEKACGGDETQNCTTIRWLRRSTEVFERHHVGVTSYGKHDSKVFCCCHGGGTSQCYLKNLTTFFTINYALQKSDIKFVEIGNFFQLPAGFYVETKFNYGMYGLKHIYLRLSKQGMIQHCA